ncbi:hypothetical protein PFISCL1PPCAC_3921 [Pristionchus fissidentatus]|uniref:Uncharacterized protein n=1 Tax=Pristionchus fissidentatus TaxID=1538716 RepID=A0AAV5V430_9BILA|nr:hypothetical protein PFISCL1PPCAC_3921 [Pristionchus fissidentatus]
MPPKRRGNTANEKGNKKNKQASASPPYSSDERELRVKAEILEEIEENEESECGSDVEILATKDSKKQKKAIESPLVMAIKENEKLKKEFAESKEREAARLEANVDLSKVKMEKADELWHANYELNRAKRMYENAVKEAGSELLRAEEAERKLGETAMKIEWNEKNLIQTEKRIYEAEKKLNEKEKILVDTEQKLAVATSASSHLELRNFQLSNEVHRMNRELAQMSSMTAEKVALIVDLGTSNDTLRAEVQRLNDELNRARQLSSTTVSPEVRKMREENSILKEQLKMAEEHINELDDSKAQIRVLRDENEKLKSLGGKTQDKLLKEANDKLKISEDRLADAEDEIKYQKGRKEELKEELLRYREDYNTRDNATAEARLRHVREKYEKLDKELRARPTIEDMGDLKKSCKDEIMKLTAELVKIRLENGKLQAETKEAMGMRNKVVQEKAVLQQRLTWYEPNPIMNWNPQLSINLPPPPPPPPIVHPSDPFAPPTISTIALPKSTTVSPLITSHTVDSKNPGSVSPMYTPTRGDPSTVPNTVSQEVVVLSDSSITVEDDDDIECLGEIPSSSSSPFRSQKIRFGL